jgi:hypothetical protein
MHVDAAASLTTRQPWSEMGEMQLYVYGFKSG